MNRLEAPRLDLNWDAQNSGRRLGAHPSHIEERERWLLLSVALQETHTTGNRGHHLDHFFIQIWRRDRHLDLAPFQSALWHLEFEVYAGPLWGVDPVPFF